MRSVWKILLIVLFPAFGQAADLAAVATASPYATTVGVDILRSGGNAFDAAVGISAALGVVEPYSSGLGGGGFWLLYIAEDKRYVVIDGRERAPNAATEAMYEVAVSGLVGTSMDGPLSAAIPGEPAALIHIQERYGTRSLSRLLAPAQKLAREGVRVTRHYTDLARFRQAALRRGRGGFLDNGEVPAVGWLLRQPHLADLLRKLGLKKRDALYRGAAAMEIADQVRKAGGIWTVGDLERYKIIERDALVGEYPGFKVLTVPPPSSGGVAILTMLNILGGYDYSKLDRVHRIHVQVEAMRRAYRDRADFLGDPDYVKVPVGLLIDPVYAAGLRASININRALPSRFLPPADMGTRSTDTTHFSVVDKDGNMVSATLSINYPFGSGFVIPGLGLLLNDEMDDFARQPGVPNAYGLVGGKANAIAGGKRPLSSMSPTIVVAGDRLAVMGTPGGSRIISMVFRAVLNFVAGHAPASWVSLPRIHHQYLPDQIEYESDALNKEELALLESMGHRLQETKGRFGNMQGIMVDRKHQKIWAASDLRGEGLAVVLSEKQ